MIIGNFTYNKAQDTYTGELATLSGATRKVVFRPSEAKADKAPHYRVRSAARPAISSSAQRGRSAATRAGNTSRSSSTIRRWPRRSTARW